MKRPYGVVILCPQEPRLMLPKGALAVTIRFSEELPDHDELMASRIESAVRCAVEEWRKGPPPA